MDEWRRCGAMVWVRFLALGVAEPLERAADWVRSHGLAPRVVLLADSSRWALTTAGVCTEPLALQALGVTAEQIRLVRPLGAGAMLWWVDGIGLDEVLAAVQTNQSQLQARVQPSKLAWDAAAAPLPEGTLPDAHINTILMASLIQGELPPRALYGAEEHIEHCSACTARYLAWMELVERFNKLPMPEPPPKKSYRVPAILLAAASAASLLSGAAVVFTVLASREDPVAERRPEPVLKLLADGRPVVLALPGQAVSVAFEPAGRRYYALVMRRGASIEVLYTGPVQDLNREQLAPVDVIVGMEAEQELYLVLSDAALDEQATRAALDGRAPPTVRVLSETLRGG